MNPPKPPMPPQPTTTKLPRVEVPLSSLDAIIAELRAIRQESTDRFAEVSARMGHVEERLGELEARGSKHSIGVRQLSETDAKHEAQFAMVLGELSALKTTQAAQGVELANQTKKLKAIEDAVVGFFTSPKVRALGRVAFSLAMAYAAAKGIKVLP